MLLPEKIDTLKELNIPNQHIGQKYRNMPREVENTVDPQSQDRANLY